MLRPITRRWGICFRSTQRYTVWMLTPKYTAASRTVSGSSSGRRESYGASAGAMVLGEVLWTHAYLGSPQEFGKTFKYR